MTVFDFGEFELDDDPARVDRDAVWKFLSTEAYWGRTRTRSDLERQLDASWRMVGVYVKDSGELVGFARAFSDGGGAAYLRDVFVVREKRGRGLGKQLLDVMIERGPGAAFRWMLHTNDAHLLYEQFGFKTPDHTYLERPKQNEIMDGREGAPG